MGPADLEAGKAVQRPFENQVREKDGGFERIANDVAQYALALQTRVLRGAGSRLRMHEYENTELLGLGPERIELAR